MVDRIADGLPTELMPERVRDTLIQDDQVGGVWSPRKTRRDNGDDWPAVPRVAWIDPVASVDASPALDVFEPMDPGIPRRVIPYTTPDHIEMGDSVLRLSTAHKARICERDRVCPAQWTNPAVSVAPVLLLIALFIGGRDPPTSACSDPRET